MKLTYSTSSMVGKLTRIETVMVEDLATQDEVFSCLQFLREQMNPSGVAVETENVTPIGGTDD